VRASRRRRLSVLRRQFPSLWNAGNDLVRSADPRETRMKKLLTSDVATWHGEAKVGGIGRGS